MRPYLKNKTKQKQLQQNGWEGCMPQVIEYLPIMMEALSSTPSNNNNNKKISKTSTQRKKR
jgi:hypothetical protein